MTIPIGQPISELLSAGLLANLSAKDYRQLALETNYSKVMVEFLIYRKRNVTKNNLKVIQAAYRRAQENANKNHKSLMFNVEK